MAEDLARLGLEIESSQVDVANRRLDALVGRATLAQRATDNLKGSMNTLKNQLLGLNGIMAAMSFGAVAAGVYKIGSAFQDTMAEVSAVTGATGKDLAELEAVTRQYGASTEYSSKQAAEAMVLLGQAGLNANQMMGALPGTLDLATIGHISLAEAADIAVSALNAMQMQVSDLSKVNDVFAKTATATNTNVQMIGEAFKYTGPIANAFGADIEELTAYIGALSNAGIQGSMAGTQLGQAYQKMGEVFAKLGVNGEGKGLVDMLELVNAAGWDQQKIMDEFTDRAARAVLILKDMTPQVRALWEANKGASGEAKRMADVIRDTASMTMKELTGIMEDIAIDVFKLSEDGIRNTATAITDFLRENRGAITDFMESMKGVVYDFKEIIVAGGRVAGVLAEVFKTTIAGYNSIPPVIREMGIVGALLLPPWARYVLALTTTAIGLVKRMVGEAKQLDPKQVEVSYRSMKDYADKIEAQLDRKNAKGGNYVVGSQRDKLNEQLQWARSEMFKLQQQQATFDAARQAPFNSMADAEAKFRAMEQEAAKKEQQRKDVEAQRARTQAAATAQFQKNMALQAEFRKAYSSVELSAFDKEKRALEDRARLYAEAFGDNEKGKQQVSDWLQWETAKLERQKQLREELIGLKTEYQVATLNDLDGQFARINAEAEATKKKFKELGDESRETQEMIDFMATKQKGQALSAEMDKARDAEKNVFEASANYTEMMRDNFLAFRTDFTKTLNDMVWGAHRSFADIAQAFGQMITQMIIQKEIAEPFVASMGSFWGLTGSAHGNVFRDGSVVPYAKGGIVDRPTLFPMAKGAGLMGEAGPEAVMPLKRLANGDLGVQAQGGGGGVTVNVINNASGAEARTEERETPGGGVELAVIIDDIMAGKVVRGKTAQALKTFYGIRPVITRR